MIEGPPSGYLQVIVGFLIGYVAKRLLDLAIDRLADSKLIAGASLLLRAAFLTKAGRAIVSDLVTFLIMLYVVGYLAALDHLLGWQIAMMAIFIVLAEIQLVVVLFKIALMQVRAQRAALEREISAGKAVEAPVEEGRQADHEKH